VPFGHAWVDGSPGPFDDAAIVRPEGATRSLVLTLDVITPVVDDARSFGRIAAANSISDVYAMGGQPEVALCFAGVPDGCDLGVLEAMLRGAGEKAAEGSCAIVGGHTIRDSEPKCGLAVVGSVAHGEAWTHRGARPGHALVLTKALGTGVVTQALRAGNVEASVLAAAVASMERLNARACELGRRHAVAAATDVTGFGLLGHLHHLARASGVSAVLRPAEVPLLPGALAAARAGFVPGGSKRNLGWVRPHLRGDVDDAVLTLLADAQTSGGLLLVLAPEPAGTVAAALAEEGAAVIGEVVAGEPGEIRFA
jgi:selenide,water dikinase